MTKKTITYFDEIDFETDDFFCTEVLLEGNKISLDLEFNNGFSEYDWVKYYESYVSKLEEYKLKIDKAIIKNFKDEEITFEYFERLLEELDDLTINKLTQNTDPCQTKLEQLLSALKLQKIEFRFDIDLFVLWSYSLGNDIADEVLVVYTDNNGKIAHFSVEN